MGLTLGTRLAQHDEARFVGRTAELSAFDDLFVPEPPASVVHLHGPGGIGKSTLLRAVARTGEQRGWRPFWVEGRDLPPTPDAVEAALEGVREEPRPLVLVDTYERMGALDAYLRRELVPSLPERALVFVCGRRAPAAGWMQDGYEAVTRVVELRPLAAEEAYALLERRGVAGDDAERIVRWAAGSPLALSLAAETAGGYESEGVGPYAIGALVRRLMEGELDPRHRGTLDVAALARVATAGMLEEVLRTDGDVELEWLAGRSFAEPLGDGVTLHDLVRRALRGELRQSAPERERELRCRIADHLHARAIEDGRPLLTVDLGELVENELIRSFYSWEGSADYRMDSLREGDDVAYRRLLAERGFDAWWEPTRPFFEHAPETIAVARDADDRLVGLVLAVTPRGAPSFAADDPLLGPWLRDAARRVPDGNVVLWRDAEDFLSDVLEAPDSPIQAMMNMAGVLQSGLANPRYTYLPVDRGYEVAVDFSTLLGGVELTELAVEFPGRPQACHFVDYGPGGILGKQRDVVYFEQGVTPPEPIDDGAADAPPPEAEVVDAEAVRTALRCFDLPGELARSPLAEGTGVEARAASVRERLLAAADEAFGAGAAEQQLRQVLVRGYLDPAPSHELAADELALSRSAYFRRLRAAVDRVARYLGG